MDGAMTREAGGGVGISVGSGLPVNAFPESFHFVGVTFCALGGSYLSGSCDFMPWQDWQAVAPRALCTLCGTWEASSS